jgi:lipoprotein-releasing system permease protein
MPSLPYEFFIGLRYLKAKRRHRGLSLGALISIGGVTIGVAALIATLAVMTGFSEEIREKILGANAHIVITDMSGGEIASYRALSEQVRKTPHVVATAPFIFRQVLLSAGENAVGVVLRGIDPVDEVGVTDIGKNMVAGKVSDLSAPIDPTNGAGPRPGIILGRELAARLGVIQGDLIHVISPVGEKGRGGSGIGGMSATPKIRKFQVVGLFDSGMLEYDTSLAYISMPQAQTFFALSDVATGIQVKVDDIFTSDAIAKDINARLTFPVVARDWMELNRSLFSALKMEKAMMFIVLVLIILVASFNIVSMLTMTVIEKGREIAILKAMGATRESILRIFMVEGVVISGTGVLLGIPLGLVICAALKKFYKLPGDVYYISELPVRILPLDIFLVVAATLLIGMLATLYPSYRAARLDPVEALRYE